MKDTNTPQIYPWVKNDISEKLKDSLKGELAIENNEMVNALVEATARMTEISTDRLNRVSDKTYRHYLELSGSDYLPASPAKTPVQFTVSDNIGDAQQEVIPKGFQISGSVEDGDEQIFETVEDITVQRPNLSSIKFVDYYRNQKTNLSGLIEADPETTIPKRLVKGEEDFQYKLHIEHPRFAELGPDSYQELTLRITFSEELASLNSWGMSFEELFDFSIQYQGEEKAESLPLAFMLNTNFSANSNILEIDIPNQCSKDGIFPIPPGTALDNIIPVFKTPIGKTTLADNKKSGYFLTICFKPKLSQLLSTPAVIEENQILEDFVSGLVPTIDAVEYKFTDTRQGTNITRAFYNSQELDLSATFLPFGEQPRINDCFYFAAPEVFEYGYSEANGENARHMKIATQIMGDLTKYQNEDDPSLLPVNKFTHNNIGTLLVSNDNGVNFLVAEYDNEAFSVSQKIDSDNICITTEAKSNGIFSLEIQGETTEIFEEAYIDESGTLIDLIEEKEVLSQYLAFTNIPPLSVPADNTFYFDSSSEYTFPSIGKSTPDDAFTIRRKQPDPSRIPQITAFIGNTTIHGFEFACDVTYEGVAPNEYERVASSEYEDNNFFLYVDEVGQVRKQSDGSLFHHPCVEFINVLPNAVPAYSLIGIPISEEIDSFHTKSTAIRYPFSAEFRTKNIDDYTNIKVMITNAKLNSFTLSYELEYPEVMEESYYSQSRFSHDLIIDADGNILHADTMDYFSSEYLEATNSHYNTTPLNTDNFPHRITGNQKRIEIPAQNQYDDLRISYEYFNGNDWQDFNAIGDGSTFHRTGQIECQLNKFHEVQKTTINGIEDWWLRARILSGGYGGPAGFKNAEPHPGWFMLYSETGETAIITEQKDFEDLYSSQKNAFVKFAFVGPAAPLIKEVPESFRPPMIREMKVMQEDDNYQRIGGEAGWYSHDDNTEFAISSNMGSIYHELPTGTVERYPDKFQDKTKENYILGGGITGTYNSDENLDPVITPNKFPMIENPNDDTGSFPALYFGFEGEKLEGTYNSLFISLEDKPFFYRKDEILIEETVNNKGETVETIVTAENGAPLYVKSLDKVTQIKSTLSWQYYGNKGWTELPVEDNTFGFTKSEKIAFNFPKDAKKSDVLGECQYWIRAIFIDPELTPMNSVMLKGAYQNTTFAENRVTVKNERLGSSNGYENQQFKLRHAPTVGGLKLCVGEVDMISENELRQLYADKYNIAIEDILPEKFTLFTNETVSIIKDENDTILGIYVEWAQVDSFVNSGPHSRHYMFDHVTGVITFGSGINGMIPDVGRENIIAKSYRYGGGLAGNLPAKKISKMRNRSQIVSKVANIDKSSGGGDRENITELLKRGSSDLHAHDRAVTDEDYEILARKATTNVAQAVAMSSHNPDGSVNTGKVTVGILTHDLGDKPIPSAHVLEEVKSYITERSPIQINNEKEPIRDVRNRLPEELKSASFYSQFNSPIEVVPPNYVKVGINADLHFTNPDEAQDVTSSIESNLATFLHPLKGNYGAGWKFGETFSSGLVEQFIRSQRGVKSVSNVSFCANQLLLTLQLSLPEDNGNKYLQLQAGRFIDLYLANYKEDPEDRKQTTLQIANATTLTNNPTTVSVIGFTEGDTIELISHQAESTPPSYTTVDKYEEDLQTEILSTGRITGFTKAYTKAYLPCSCKAHDGPMQTCDCGCQGIDNQQPIYYIDTEFLRIDSITKAVLPAEYDEIDGVEEQVVNRTIFYEKIKEITSLEVRTIRGFTEESRDPDYDTSSYKRTSHAIKAYVKELIAADGTIYVNSGCPTDPAKGIFSFDKLHGGVEIVKIGIEFPSFIFTDTTLHNDLYGALEAIKLNTHAVDPQSKTVHLTDWDLPYAGDFNISDASNTPDTSSTGV